MTKKFETLYKQSSGGKITVWNIESYNDSYIINSGFADGAIQTFVTNVKDAKNSKTLNEQADKMAESAWNLKKKTMYTSIEKARNAFSNKSLSLGGYEPMLAKVADLNKKQKFNLNNCLIQPKLDGLRILARKIDDEVLLYARSGALKTTVPHINEQLNEMMQNGEIFDGEVYKFGLELESILSLVQADKNRKDTSQLDYWIYDFPRIGELTEANLYIERYKDFVSKFDNDGFISNNITFTPTTQVESIADIKRYHANAVDDNYEGTILRNPLAPYQNKRTGDLLKLKTFQDAEYPIIGVNEGSGKLEGHAGTFTLAMQDGRTFEAKLKGDTSQLKYYFEHPEEAIGKMLTVQFFAFTKYGIPRFPVGVRIRNEA